MTDVWFTSDTHLGHKNILEYEKEARPFETVEEMNEALISNWNDTVRPKDIIWHLGDFAFGRSNVELAGRLNGRKRLIMGNHDVYNNSVYMAYFEKLFGVTYWKRCVLSHIPVHVGNLGSRALLNVHGHLHSNVVKTDVIYCVPGKIFGEIEFIKDINYFNVSVEQHNLRPVNSSLIMDRLKEIIE
jgi:calcineurin-like phosphoesterase family protein